MYITHGSANRGCVFDEILDFTVEVPRFVRSFVRVFAFVFVCDFFRSLF